MKKFNFLPPTLLAVVLALGLGALAHNISGGKLADDFQLVSAHSQTFTDQEIQDATDAVIRSFKNNLSGATMTELRYVDSNASVSSEDWAKDYGAEQGVFFYSDFTTDEFFAPRNNLNPNDTYEYHWYVVRSDGGSWNVVNSGQG